MKYKLPYILIALAIGAILLDIFTHRPPKAVAPQAPVITEQEEVRAEHVPPQLAAIKAITVLTIPRKQKEIPPVLSDEAAQQQAAVSSGARKPPIVSISGSGDTDQPPEDGSIADSSKRPGKREMSAIHEQGIILF